jgi:regulator of RNase E activity RraA
MVSASVVARMAALAVPTISAVLYKKGLRSRFLYGLTPLNPALRFAGPAHTIRAIPVREDMRDAVAAGQAPNNHRLAFAAAKSGEVIVIAGGGVTGVSLLGDIIATSLQMRGIAGVVADSDVSDAALVAQMAIPVVAVGSAPVPGPAKLMVVDWGVPVAIGNVAIFPGDIIVGDANGAICVPHELANEVADATEEAEQLETFLLERVRAGAALEGTYPPDAATRAAYEVWRKTGGGSPS